MVDLRRLPRAQQIAVARLDGTALWLAAGNGGDPVATLHAISQDPKLLGLAAARHTVEPTTLDRTAADLLRRAGADEQVIAEHARQVREWRRLPMPEAGGRRGQPDSPSGGSSSSGGS